MLFGGSEVNVPQLFFLGPTLVLLADLRAKKVEPSLFATNFTTTQLCVE